MNNNKLFVLIVLLLNFINCKKSDEIQKEEKISIIKNELNNSLSNIIIDHENLFEVHNEKYINKSLMQLDSLVLISNSKHKYFYSLIKSKLLFLKGKPEESLNELEAIKNENPLLYNYYYGILLELNGSKDEAIKKYKIAINFCINNEDIACLVIQFLIDNNQNKFLSFVKEIDSVEYKSLNTILKYDSTIDNFRKKIITDDFFGNYIFPNDDMISTAKVKSLNN